MFLKFNEDILITDFEDGKLLTEVVTSESYYLDFDSFKIIEDCLDKYIEMEKLYKDIFEYKDFIEFIQFLILKNILLKRR